MGNIVGEGFDSRITGQVNRRQKTHGSGYDGEILRTNEELVVLNNNTAWVKLMSSVSIDNIDSINNPTIKGFGRKGADISKAFVLFNGTSAYDNNETIQRGGIDFTNTLGGYDNVYGIGGSVDFGLNPMMGITGIDVKHKNRGSIRTATVTVKAFNRAQFEIIDVLYMRLGFSVLLEWGNSMYFKNDDTYVSDGGQENSLTSDWFKDSDYQSFLGKIRNKSLSSDGNYDAMLAKVSNYHWSFQKDGSYDITIDLVSAGDVVESFKMDAAAANLQPPSAFTGSSYPAKIVNARDKHKLGAYLYDELNYINSIIGGDVLTAKATSKFLDVDEDDPTKTVQHNSSFNEKTSDSLNEGDDMFFFRMGDLLHWIQENQMYKSNGKPILTFDYAYKDNLMGIHKIDNVPLYNSGNQFDTWPNNHVLHQVSYDPFTCIALQFFDETPSHNIASIHGGVDASLDDRASIGTRISANVNFTVQDTFEKKIKDEYYGKIMNIYLNFEFLLDTMENEIDEDGNVSLIDFLKSVLKGVNEAFGGINDLQVTIDPLTSKVRIIDINPLHSPKNLVDYFKLESTSANFNLYGYSEAGGKSNFIHDFNLTTEITPALSTMITVAATSNKTVVGEDNTALSKINKGLSDRYRKDLEEPPSLKIPKLAQPPQSYTPNMLQFLKLAYGCDGDINSMKLAGGKIDYTAPGGLFQHVVAVSAMFAVKAQCDIYKRKAKKIFQLYHNIKKGIINGNELTPVGKSGFIPFNLSLTMDGLGGMKIYQKFNVDTNFMPSNYPSNIEFLIKNIQHTIKDNKWITKLESFCVSKPGDNVKSASTPTVTGAGLGLHSSITITSAYKSGSTKATYVATIDNGIPAVEDIVITFTDTLKNKDQSTAQPVPLSVIITIPKGSITSNLTEYTFSDAVYGAIEQSSVKLFPKFTVPKLGEKYYIQIGESIFGNSNIADLITFTGKSGDIQHFNSLAPEFKKAFVELAQAYKTKTGKKITLNSAVRLQAEQTVLWNTWRAGGGNDPERPDYNKNEKTVLEVNGIYRPLKEVGQGHGAGTAVDVSPNSSELALLPEFKTLGFNSVDGDPPHIEIKYTPLKIVRLTLDNNSITPYI